MMSLTAYTDTAWGGGFNDVIDRYKLEQTIRHLHGFHGTSDPRASFPAAPFSGV